MIAFAGILVNHAKAAGMAVPPDPENYEPDDFIHWHVFCLCQLGASIPYPQAIQNNAAVINKLSNEQIRTVTYKELKELGFNDSNSSGYA